MTSQTDPPPASERLRRTLFGEHPYAVVAPTEWGAIEVRG
jgi:hypothetical protein